MHQTLTGPPRRVSHCRAGGQALALDLASVRGVGRADRVAWAEDAWPHVGDLPTPDGRVPVLSLAGLLGLPPEVPGPDAQVVRCDTPDGPVALLVDQLAGVTEAAPGSVVPVPRSVGPVRFASLLWQGDELLPLIDPARLLSEPRLPRAPGDARGSAGPSGRLLLLPLTDAAPVGRPWVAGVPMAADAEVTRPGRVVAVPGCHPYVVGVTGWRGAAVAVVDLPAWLGMPPAGADPDAQLVVARWRGAGEPVGLLVRRGVRVLKLPAPHVRSARPFPGDRRRVLAAVEVGPATVGLADLGELWREPSHGDSLTETGVLAFAP